MNVLVLLGGDSKAFQEAGFAYPKDLVEVAGVPVIQRVSDAIQSLRSQGARTIFVVRGEENRRYHIGDVINLLDPEAVVVEIPSETAGAACSALLATEHIQNDEPLLILNGDSLVTVDLRTIVADFQKRRLDGGIVVFDAIHPRWSYVKCDSEGNVVETAEKRPISRLATAGIYYFQCGKDFVEAAMNMIMKDANVADRFYVCPSYNELILRQFRIGIFTIDRDQYFSLSTPQGVAVYEEHLRNRAKG